MNRTKGGWQLAKLTLRKTEQTKPQIIRTPGIDRTIKIRLLRCKNGKRPNRELAEALLSAGRGCQIFLKFCSHAHLISSLKCATRTDICREGALHIQSLTWTSHITTTLTSSKHFKYIFREIILGDSHTLCTLHHAIEKRVASTETCTA